MTKPEPSSVKAWAVVSNIKNKIVAGSIFNDEWFADRECHEYNSKPSHPDETYRVIPIHIVPEVG